MKASKYLCWSLTGGLAVALSGCMTPPVPVQPPPVVATLPPPPPSMPAGGYVGMKSPAKRADGTYGTPNLNNTDQAAVWHLRNALNVAALGCEQAGGGVIEPYNSWITSHAAVLDRYYHAYIKEWQETGWGDWERVYDDNQTRIYNFYAQPAMRTAFCAVARNEVTQIGQVADDDLVAFARASLLRLDRPFVEFYAAYDAWRNYYDPAPPPVVRTVDVPVTPPSVVSTVQPVAEPPTTAAAASDNVSMESGTVPSMATPVGETSVNPSAHLSSEARSFADMQP
ncbi:hypothetical protein [Sphingomonas sp. Mn802worker]|uniref:hypothetical protein n=1 Tax=Sphingomonas sp. Mn802worker TaxID=629773 RepID=UPI00036B2381|nr:hypothetical protein [Sphingomonas sp. Mn802worker]